MPRPLDPKKIDNLWQDLEKTAAQLRDAGLSVVVACCSTAAPTRASASLALDGGTPAERQASLDAILAAVTSAGKPLVTPAPSA